MLIRNSPLTREAPCTFWRLAKVCQYLSGNTHLIQRSDCSRFPIIGSWTPSPVRERGILTFAILLTLLCRMDLTRTHGLSTIPPIGVGKRSCLCCVLWIESDNRIFGTQWTISGSHGKPYVNWATSRLLRAPYYAIEEDGKGSLCVRNSECG